jgi:hypothetical protein
MYLTQCAEYRVTAGHLAGMKYLYDEVFENNLFFNRYRLIVDEDTVPVEEDVYLTDHGVQVYVNKPDGFGFDKQSNTPQRKIDNAILYKVIIPKGTKYYKSKQTKYQKNLMLTAEKVVFVEPVEYGKGLSEEHLESAKQYIEQTRTRYDQLPEILSHKETK